MQLQSRPWRAMGLAGLAALLSAGLLLAPREAGAQGDAGGHAAQEAGGQPLVLSTIGGTWVVQGEFTGRMSVGADSIGLSFDKARLVLRPGSATGTRRRVVSVTPCLATATREAPFTIARRGTPIEVGQDVSEGQECVLDSPRSSIALDNTVDLAQHWLVLEIQLSRTAPDGTTSPSFVFIHSDHGIFTPRP